MSGQNLSDFEYHAEIAAALGKSVAILTRREEKGLDALMKSGLKPLADAAGLNRVVFCNMSGENKRPREIYSWSYGRDTPQKKQTPMLDYSPLKRWKPCLEKGDCIDSSVKNLPREDADFLKARGIKSILVIPVFTEGKLWGIVAMEDHNRFRTIGGKCLELFRTAGYIYASVFIHVETEQKLFEANEYNCDLLSAAPIGFTVVDEKLRILECNDTIVNILGTTKRHYIEHFGEYSPEFQNDGENTKEYMEEIIKRALKGEVMTFEWTHLSLSGEAIPFEVSITRVKRGKEYIALAYQYDVRNIRKIEKAASNAENLIQIVTDASPFPYVMFDDSLHAIDCNKAAMKLFKCPDKKFFLNNYMKSFSPKFQPDGQRSDIKVKGYIAEVYMNGKQCIYEWIHSSLDGELIPMENTLTPAIYDGRKVVISFKYDMRGIKKLMYDLEKKSEELNETLDRMKAVSEAKGIFLSNMSHEMRTPLNTISGMATIGKKSCDMERKNYTLDKIEEASTHLLGVINDILDMSKIEANKLELVSADFSFEKTIKKAIDTVYFSMEQKELYFHVAADGKIPYMLSGDDQRLTQVILNLLSNAVKFTPAGGTIGLSTRLLDDTDGICTIAVEVSDTGIGIGKEQEEKLFHAFEQADNSISRKYGGTGLGLAISKRIVELMGGRIGFKSEPGKGSVFSFTFRAAHGEGGSQALLDPSVNWKNVKILTVDDDPVLLSYFSEILKLHGMKCDTALNGTDAMELIEKNGLYDIYFLDWNMPQINGVELARKIKNYCKEKSKKSVVIMISATEWVQIHDEAKEAGVDKYLMKPFFSSELIDCLNSCMALPDATTSDERDIITPEELKGCRILLVEDMEINREILLALMEGSGAEIECAENGLKALNLVKENPEKYDLVFMDIQMPEMDGLEAARQIRLHGIKTPIIAMTANVFREDIEKYLAIGMDAHISKPINMEDVMKAVRKYWPGRKRRISSKESA